MTASLSGYTEAVRAKNESGVRAVKFAAFLARCGASYCPPGDDTFNPIPLTDLSPHPHGTLCPGQAAGLPWVPPHLCSCGVRTAVSSAADLPSLRSLAPASLMRAIPRGEEQVMHIDIVADIACPWCFIGKRRLERALALRPDIVATRSWRAFQLNPDMPAEGISREFYLVAKFGGARQATRSFTTISAAGRSAGIEFAFERIRRTPNTLRAHRLIRLAAS